MQNGAKIQLSTQEMELVTNKEWLFLKRSILVKMEAFLGSLHRKYSEMMAQENLVFNEKLKNKGGKISKGDNYKGLPYMILDYPAQFSKNHIFAIRTMFWWGNFLSISLHLSGKSHFPNSKNREKFSYLQGSNFYIYSGHDEWNHDLDEENYIALNEIDFNQFQDLLSNKFFKISKKINLSEIDKAPEFLEEGFFELMEFLKISSHPNDEKDL